MLADFVLGSPAPIDPVSVSEDDVAPVLDESLTFAIETANVRDSERRN